MDHARTSVVRVLRRSRHRTFGWSARSVLAVGLVSVLLPAGCVTVPPSQRGYLARPEMNPATGALEESFHSHVEAAREAGFGGHGTQGGGCGCG